MNLVYFDTALGFASVMLMLSMLVTIIVQMISAGVNLRGHNLRWGVERLITKLDPEKKMARELADKILTNDALSHTLGRYAEAIRPAELRLVLEDLKKTNENNDLGKAAESLMNKIDDTKTQFETWFNTVMDRTTERFVARAGLLTVLVSFLLAITLHIDTPYIIKNLSSKPEVRTALVTAALNQATPLYQQLDKAKPIPHEALNEAIKEDKTLVAALTPAVEIKTRADGSRWLAEQVKDAKRRDAISDKYEKAVDKLGRERLDSLGSSYKKVSGWIEASELQFGPPDASYCTFGPFKCEFTKVGIDHILGILITGLFLGLGAPFWFNLLRNMSNLRPILAGKVEADKKAA